MDDKLFTVVDGHWVTALRVFRVAVDAKRLLIRRSAQHDLEFLKLRVISTRIPARARSARRGTRSPATFSAWSCCPSSRTALPIEIRRAVTNRFLAQGTTHARHTRRSRCGWSRAGTTQVRHHVHASEEADDCETMRGTFRQILILSHSPLSPSRPLLSRCSLTKEKRPRIINNVLYIVEYHI